jgi:hypothetical protein
MDTQPAMPIFPRPTRQTKSEWHSEHMRALKERWPDTKVFFEGEKKDVWEFIYEIRRERKECKKLQQRLNRITNLMIGNERIWVLDRLAMELEVNAALLDTDLAVDAMNALKHPDKNHMGSDQRARKQAYADQMREDTLFLRRLEWDLGELHVAVKGDTNRRGGRYDQANWKGVRP